MSARALKALKAKRAAIKAQCTRTRNAIDAIYPQAVDVMYVKQRKEKFAEHWNQFNEIQTQIVEVLELADGLEDVEQLKIEQETECVNFEESYFNLAGKIEQLLISVRESTNIHATRDNAPKPQWRTGTNRSRLCSRHHAGSFTENRHTKI